MSDPVFRPARGLPRAHPHPSRTIAALARIETHGGQFVVLLKQGEHGQFVDLRQWIRQGDALVPGKGLSLDASYLGTLVAALAEASLRTGTSAGGV